MDASKRLEKRRSSWGGILVEGNSFDSSSDEEDREENTYVFNGVFGTYHVADKTIAISAPQ
jgi:hypothetical protein